MTGRPDNVQSNRAHVSRKNDDRIAELAKMFSAMGAQPRLRILLLLLSAHPEGLVVGDIQEKLDIPNSTLSHHLEKLKHKGLVEVKRQSTFLHYKVRTDALEEILRFLFEQCGSRAPLVRSGRLCFSNIK